jgi:hypothetical protein
VCEARSDYKQKHQAAISALTRRVCGLPPCTPRDSLNSFFGAFHPYERPFIGKSCPSAASHVIDVAGFSTACLAKIVLIFLLRYENQPTRFKGRDSTARRG